MTTSWASATGERRRWRVCRERAVRRSIRPPARIRVAVTFARRNFRRRGPRIWIRGRSTRFAISYRCVSLNACRLGPAADAVLPSGLLGVRAFRHTEVARSLDQTHHLARRPDRQRMRREAWPR